MRQTRRGISVCVTTLTAMAIAIPTQTAAAAVVRHHSMSSNTSRGAVLTRERPHPPAGQRSADPPAGRTPLPTLARHRSRARCNWKRCWWTQRIGIGYYLVVKFTWSGTWRVRDQLRRISSLREAGMVLCGFLGRHGPACGAITWASVKYWTVMTNRALSHRRCLVGVRRLAGIGFPFALRTARCAR
jgi:hypothetical protein